MALALIIALEETGLSESLISHLCLLATSDVGGSLIGGLVDVVDGNA